MLDKNVHSSKLKAKDVEVQLPIQKQRFVPQINAPWTDRAAERLHLFMSHHLFSTVPMMSNDVDLGCAKDCGSTSG